MKNNGDVAAHYDGSAETYHLQYERDLLSDISRNYPANYFRMHKLINSFSVNNINRVVEIGVGEGTPLISLAKLGMDVHGIDISEKMVLKSKDNFKRNGLEENRISWGDIQDPMTYTHIMQGGKFDGLLAMGVMPHVRNDEFVINNMKSMLKPNGKVFIEFRNKLFSLFTFNRHTYEFILDDLLKYVGPSIKNLVSENLKKRLEMEEPKPRLKGASAANVKDVEGSSSTPGYDAILSKFHNPFEVLDMFRKCGFQDLNLMWYHYHPAMPYLSVIEPKLFRDEALKLEHETSGWRGMFLCSAFVVEATVRNK